MRAGGIQRIHFINRINENNVGDWNCCPLNYFYEYFNQYAVLRHDIDHIRWVEVNRNDVVVLGGGGMLYVEESFQENISRLFDTGAAVIGWSLGFNTHFERPVATPIDLNGFSLIGIRDYLHESGFPYVPCVSCLSSELAKNAPVVRRIGMIAHADYPIDGFDHEKISHSLSIERVTDFIASSEIIITDSYHGTYFALLMGKKVICVQPFSTKFNHFKYKPVFYSGDLEQDIADARNYKGIREEAIALNFDFFNRVKEFIAGYIGVADSEYGQIYEINSNALTIRHHDLLARESRRTAEELRELREWIEAERKNLSTWCEQEIFLRIRRIEERLESIEK